MGTLLIIGLLSIFHSVAQTTGNDDRYRLFIDFLKQEKLYQDDISFYPFPFEDLDMRSYYHDRPVVTDSAQIAGILRNSIFYNKFRFLAEYDAQLLLPHSIRIDTIDNKRYNARAKVAVPDSTARLQFSAADIGVTRRFDQLEITLMKIEEDVAYLLLEDKSHKQNYAYTQVDRLTAVYLEMLPEEKEAYLSPELNYQQKFDIYDPGYKYEVRNPDTRETIYHTTARIKGLVRGGKGEVLGYETLVDDFRNALWLWNEEAPGSPWKELRAQWKKHPLNTILPEDSLQHPLYVVRLQATGRIARLDFTVLSHSMHHLDINMQQETFATAPLPPLRNGHNSIRYIDAPIQNETDSSLAQKLKVVPYSYLPQAGWMQIVAFLPVSYNIQDQTVPLSFSHSAIVHPNGGRTEITDSRKRYGLHTKEKRFMDVKAYPLSVAAINVPLPTEAGCRLTATVDYIYPNFKATRYDIGSLPKNIRYEGNHIYYELTPKELAQPVEISASHSFHAYDAAGKPVKCYRRYISKGYSVECTKPIAWFTVTVKEGSIHGSIPVDIPLPMPEAIN